jgi:hypothetical protein
VLTDGFTVCVSSAMIQEVKRIIKESEILKYGSYLGSDMQAIVVFANTA